MLEDGLVNRRGGKAGARCSWRMAHDTPTKPVLCFPLSMLTRRAQAHGGKRHMGKSAEKGLSSTKGRVLFKGGSWTMPAVALEELLMSPRERVLRLSVNAGGAAVFSRRVCLWMACCGASVDAGGGGGSTGVAVRRLTVALGEGLTNPRERVLRLSVRADLLCSHGRFACRWLADGLQ